MQVPAGGKDLMGGLMKISFSLVLLGLTSLVFSVFLFAWVKPEKIRRSLRKQGIRGPPPRLFFGNLGDVKRISRAAAARARRGTEIRGVVHDHPSTLFPHITLWRSEYGNTFFYSNGNMITLYVGDLDLVKEICLCNSLDLGKPSFVGRNQGALLGKGILSANGHAWAVQRRVIAPEFVMEKVKGMIDLMVQSATPLVESWAAKVDQEGDAADIRVDEGLKSVAADVISRSCFGSSYLEGQEIFSRIRALQKALAGQSSFIGITGLRYLPIRSNREIWRLAREIKAMISKIVRKKELTGDAADQDLLHALHRGAPRHGRAADDFVVDNCRNIYFAGHETVATVAKWVLVLLASNPEWQARVRREVAEVCNGAVPGAETLRRMTLLTMVILETMRLYPPAPTIVREALREMRFGQLRVPKGTLIWVPRITLFHDPGIWGPTAGEFDPGRFAQGVSEACAHPYLYNPFGVGPRTCLGQHFAMVELKVLLSRILSRFAVSLSPRYRHSVVHRLILEPEHGVNLVLTRL